MKKNEDAQYLCKLLTNSHQICKADASGNVQKTGSFTPGLTYCLTFYCLENSRKKVRCSRRRGRQNESWLSVCAVMAWRKNGDCA